MDSILLIQMELIDFVVHQKLVKKKNKQTKPMAIVCSHHCFRFAPQKKFDDNNHHHYYDYEDYEDYSLVVFIIIIIIKFGK